MKKFYFLLVLFSFACDSENAPDCFQLAGTIVQVPISVASFDKIRMEHNVSLVIRQGETQDVILETGENLLSDITVEVNDGILVLRDNNQCNYVRDFGITKVTVTAPNIVEIRNGSSYDVVGEGELNFPNLHLISNTTGGFEDIRKSGDFTMTINSENFTAEANGFSGFYIDGQTENATISFEDEWPRFEGAELIVDDLRIFHRSANKMIVNPQLSIRGRIIGVGDVISLNRPEIIEVEELYSGRLLFQ
jgi:Putative auto-transporter adhesin, head GIN domain